MKRSATVDPPDRAPRANLRPGGLPTPAWVAVLATIGGLALAAALAAGVPWLTKPLCWPWPYRGIAPWSAVRCLLPGLLPFAGGLALLRGSPSRRRVAIAVALFAVATFALEIGTLFLDEHGFATLELRVEHSGVTSYFTDALAVRDLARFLREFPPPGLHVHSSTHPPGPIVGYWLLLRLFPAPLAARVGGLAIGIMAAAVAALLYPFARLWAAEPRERAYVAALWPLLSCVVGFLPELDQIYPAFTIGISLGWHRALLGSRRSAVLTGALFALAVFFAWNLLLLGVLVAAMTLGWVMKSIPTAARWRAAALAGLITGATFVLVMVVFRLLLDYHPVGALRAALSAQSLLGLERTCPWRFAVFSGPWDLVLTTGATPILLWCVAVAWALRPRREMTSESSMTLAGAATLLIVDLAARLPQETARVWLFLLPLVVAPAGILLARLPPRWRASVLIAQATCFVVATTRLFFIGLS